MVAIGINSRAVTQRWDAARNILSAFELCAVVQRSTHMFAAQDNAPDRARNLSVVTHRPQHVECECIDGYCDGLVTRRQLRRQVTRDDEVYQFCLARARIFHRRNS